MKTSSIEHEYNEINSRSGWNETFQSIKERSDQEAKERKFFYDESSKSNNRRLNRYRDVNPYDHSRIILRKGDGDYINANLIKMDKAKRKYILTQGPLETTIGHFWLMIWEQNSKAILMLNKLIENKQIKCHKYWPDNKGAEHKMILTDVGLTIEYVKQEEYTHYTKRFFRLTDIESTKSREVIQFHYNTWPDFGIPSSPIAFLQFLKQVRDSGALSSDVGPAVVHCSAGIGRSGTFCLVDTCLVLVDNEGENKVSVQDLLLELRRYRMGLIQTTDQLYFSYQAIIEGIKHLNDPGFNDYEEVPVISYDDEGEECPPPLPPPRLASLVGVTQKPLPLIPCSASAHEFRDVNNSNNVANSDQTSTTSNNNTTSTTLSSSSSRSNSIDRPLPPIPRDNSLEKVDESASDSNTNDNSYNDSDHDDNDDDDEEIEENHSDDEENDRNCEKNDKNNDTSFDPNATLPPIPSGDKSILTNGLDYNGDVSDRHDSTEVRRRRRQERQSLMEDKIKEIKRKQKASEDEPRKKRRSHLITIAAGVGVVVGIICLYAYAKFG